MDEIDKTIKEVEETMARFTAIEENGKEKILHYFDRIHNHLFTFNNLMIAGFFFSFSTESKRSCLDDNNSTN